MKIGIEAQRIFRKKKHGMEVVTIELIRQLQKIDKDNEYVIFVKNDDDNQCIQETANFKIVIVPGISYPDWEQIHLPKAIKKEKLDLVHFTSNTASLSVNIPMVLTLHDIIYMESISFSGTHYQNIGNLYRRFILPRIIKKCDAVITVSHYEQERIANHFKLPNDKIKVVYNAKSDAFKEIDNKDLLLDIRQKYSLPSEFILFLGNTAPKKNSKRLIHAYGLYAKKVTNPLPIVIADLSQDYIVSVLKEYNIQGIEDKIIVQDYILHKDLPAIYNLASVFIYPSLRESFGLPIIEAMACGTPVITSNTSSMPEVADNAAILINPLNVEDIANKLETLTSDNALRQDLIKKGYERSKEFSWNNTAKDVIDLYTNILNR